MFADLPHANVQANFFPCGMFFDLRFMSTYKCYSKKF